MLVRLVTPRVHVYRWNREKTLFWRIDSDSPIFVELPAGQVVLDPIVEHKPFDVSTNCIQSVTSHFLNHFLKRRRRRINLLHADNVANAIFWFMFLRVQLRMIKKANTNLFYKKTQLWFFLQKYGICTQISSITKKQCQKYFLIV